jgi:hypothetical protein
MTIDPNEAATSLKDIALVERRTREALFYAGSSTIFILWGILVASGYGLTELYPGSARIIWPAVTAVGCATTALIIALRWRACQQEARDWRIIWAMAVLAAFGAVWSYLLGPVVPGRLMYAFQPTLFLLGIILAGIWLGRFFVVLGVVGIALIAIGYLQAEPWLRLWMAAVESGTLIVGGIWLGRSGVAR